MYDYAPFPGRIKGCHLSSLLYWYLYKYIVLFKYLNDTKYKYEYIHPYLHIDFQER